MAMVDLIDREVVSGGSFKTLIKAVKANVLRVVSLNELTAIADSKVKFTPIGGLAIKLINNTGAPTIKGNLVAAGSVDGTVELNQIQEPDTFGIFLDSGVAEGAEAWVVVNGIAEVYFIGDTIAGQFARSGLTADTGEVTGQAIAENIPSTPFATDKHFAEIGHIIESRIGAGLAKCVLHFN